MKKIFVTLTLLIPTLFSLSFASASAEVGSRFKKVVWLVFENEDYAPVIKQPQFAELAKKGALFTQMFAEIHPSQGNYVAMIAGSAFNIKTDGNINLSQNHVGDLLEKAGMNWKVYAENYPGKCYLGGSSGSYARKHVPFLSFTNVTKNPTRCAQIENSDHFFTDYNNNALPEFTMYIPNQKNDGHDTGVDFAGKWMKSKFGSIFANPENMKDTLFIVTFDEGSYSANNLIYTVLLGNNVQQGVKNSQKLNHTSLLKMIEDEFSIGNLGREDSKAPAVVNIWK